MFGLLAGALAAAASEPPRFERSAFALPESIWSVEAIDVNGDAKRDLVAMGVTKVFALVAPDWREQVLVDTREGKMLYCVALDADADGDMDLALGRYQIPWIEFRQPRPPAKQLPPPMGPDFSVAWIENTRRTDKPWPLHVVDRELNGIHGLAAGDVNGDGRTDVISDSISGPAFPNSVVWFAFPRGRGEPTRHIVTHKGAAGRPHYLDFADLDRDGKGDILLGDSGGGTFTWWNRGERATDGWAKHMIAREKGATNIKAADVDGDGTLDVVGSCGHGRGVFWFKGATWAKHEIDPALATPHALAVADFDRDGDMDVAVASYTTFVVRWYENDGHGSFNAHDIDTANRQQAYDLKAIDVDGDSRVDLVLAGRESKNCVWYRNR